MVPIKTYFNEQKIPLIPPLFHENKFVREFKVKALVFDSNFERHCFLINGSSNLLLYIHYSTDNHLPSLSFSQDKIGKVIQNLDSNKAHGYEISTC